MNESRTKRTIKNIFSGFIFKFIGLLFPFIIKTIIIRELGIEYLGLNNLFASILMVLSLSELGIGSALVFNMYKPIANHDTDRVCALLKIYRDIYRIIGLIIAVIGLILMPFLPFLIKGGYPSTINIYILYVIYLINTVLSYFLFAYKKSIWEANQLNGHNSILETITTLIMYICQIVVLKLFKNYYIYIIFMPITTFLLNILRNYFVNKSFPEYKCRGNLEKGFIKELYKKIKALLGHKIGSTVITSADSIVISSIIGLQVLAIYSNYYQIINALIGVITIFYTSTTASIGNSIVKSDTKSIINQFYSLTFTNNWIVSWTSICLLCLFQPFMELWMGKDLMFEFYIVILFVIFFYSWLFRRIGLTYKDAAGMWEQDFWKPYIGMIINVIANIVLCHYIGVSGALLSTIFIMIFIYFPWETQVLFKNLFKTSPKKYYIRMITYAIATVIIAIITYYLCSLIKGNAIIHLIIKGIMCCIIPNILFIVCYFRMDEFKDMRNRILNIIKRK